jgi:hypothetical protein
VKIHQLILLSVLVSFYLLPASVPKAFSLLPPPPVQPPPIVNTPPSLLSPGGTTGLPNTPWTLCQSLPQRCILAGVVGGANIAPPSFEPQSCPIGSILISNQCIPTSSPDTRPSTSEAPSSNGCLPGELAEDNLCIRAQSTLTNTQQQQQQQQLQTQQQQLQSVCPQGTVLENNLCFPQQQVQTANFTSPGQQAIPQGNPGHESPSIVLNGQSLQRSENGTNIATSNSVSCKGANQSSSYCNTNTSAYQSTNGKFSTSKPNNGLNDTNLHLPRPSK